MHSFVQDLRHGARLLLRTPGFTVIAILTLGLGIGANTAVFTMVRSTLFSMFGPVPEPSRVERIWASNLTTGSPRMPMSMPDFEGLRQQSRSFSGMAAWTTSSWLLDFGHGPVRISGARVSSDFFSVLQATPALGRGLRASNDRLTAVISDRLWRQTYASDPAILSRTLDIEGLSYTIVGVMPEKFWYQGRGIDVWIPLAEPATGWNRAERAYMVFGRLQTGVTEQQADAELAALAQRLAGQFPTSNHGWSFVPVSLWHEQWKRLGMTGIFLFAPVLFVLLIACANVGTMLLARASVRQGEIAVRAALGGSRARLVRQLLTESLLLSFGGAVTGFAVAIAAVHLLIAFLPTDSASTFVHIDFAVFVFALGVALVTCVLFGLSPALAATNVNLNTALKERESSTGASRGKQLSRERLIAWQVGLAVIFVVISAAFGRGILRIQNAAASAGFDPHNLISFDITPSSARFAKPEQLATYYNDLQQRLEAVPGVQSVGASTFLPLVVLSHRPGTQTVTLDPAPPSSDSKPFAINAAVTPGFFETARIPLRRGRAIGQLDTPKSLPVACVNETFARRYSPNQDILGKHVRIGSDGPWLTIVGVIADTLDDPILNTSSPHVYVAESQSPDRTLGFVIRPAGDPAAVVPAIRRAVWDFDRDQDLDEIVTAQQSLDDIFRGAWTAVSIMGTFAAIGLLLAATGVYGIMSFITAQRTREVGVRLALGASPQQILAQVLSRGAFRIALGLGTGLLIGAGFLVAFHRTGTSGDAALLRPGDPLPYVIAAAALAGAALLGTYIPARRASKVDPMVALRYE